MYNSANNGCLEVFFFEVHGNDQLKPKFPNFQSKMPKDVEPDFLHIHLTCIRYEGSRADDIYEYTDTFPRDSGNMVTVIWKTLKKVPNRLKFFALDFTNRHIF